MKALELAASNNPLSGEVAGRIALTLSQHRLSWLRTTASGSAGCALSRKEF